MFKFLIITLLFIINKSFAAVSYNQPKFCPNATWNPIATTFTNRSTIDTEPYGIFVNTNNTVYVAVRTRKHVQVWLEGSISPRTVNFSSSPSYSLFVTINGDIYEDNGYNRRVEKSTLNAKQSITIMNVRGYCRGLFVDINDTLYCSLYQYHQVIKKSLNSTTNTSTVVAGYRSSGSLSNMLYYPCGIFVDINFDLYVADSRNNRIQLFKSGELNATTLAGAEVRGTIKLNLPTGIVLDADKYLFIVDSDNHRIVGSNSNGFRCLVGCSGSSGSTSNKLNNPITLSFDSYGNMFVTDRDNNRIQKFILSTKPCNCFPSKLTLITKLLNSSLIEYKLNEEIYINSNIEMNCEELFSTKLKWTIFNCTSNCLNLNEFDQKIQTTSNEIYIPPKMLTYGIYRFNLTVTIITSSNSLSSSTSIYVKIVKSKKIFVNLIKSGTSEITLGQNQELLLEPGKYSVDEDGNTLNENEWEYKYYCRIYPLSEISNSSCFTNQLGNQRKSSLKIVNGSFQSNRTYQLIVRVTNHLDSTLNNTGYLLIHIQDTFSHRISIDCVISTMCISDTEYQLINPTTQISLISHCLDNCSSNKNIHWNIYQGTKNSSTNIIQWIQFNQNIQTFGNGTNHFTVSNELFVKNRLIDYFKFEVIYKFEFENGISSSSINFMKNSPPSNGSCSIDPLNGTITTLFNIICSNWFDENGIKDYSIYVWTDDYSNRIMIGFSSIPRFKIRLPIGNNENFLLNLNINIRDKFDCIKELNISPIYVYDNLKEIENLLNNLKDTNNTFIQTLLTGNQNDIGQIIISTSQQFNKMTNENLDNVVSSGIPMTSISISTLDSQTSQSKSVVVNQSILQQYNKELNIYANIREYFINFTTNLTIIGSNSILLQSSSLVKLTDATNQLTRITSMIASEKCYQLAEILNNKSQEISFDDVKKGVTLLIQCTSNILNAINGPLQERINVLQLDLSRSDDNHLLNFYYQKEFANKISSQITKTTSLLTLALNNHFNLNQDYLINTSQVFMSFQKIFVNQLSNKTIQNSKINFPSNFSSSLNQNQNILIRSKVEALASFGNYLSNTNLSRSLSISILDEYGKEISIKTNNSIELIIPRDPNLIFPEMILQNVTNNNQSFYFKSLDFNKLKSNKNLTISIHFEIEPLNFNIGYLFIYQFDKPIKFNQLNGWELFCPLNLTNETIYTYYIDNQQTSIHESIIFGLRELTSSEFEDICLNNITNNLSIKNSNSNFTSNYKLRIYSSGCYYLDKFNNWQSDGLLVGPKTNLYKTQCFTKHF